MRKMGWSAATAALVVALGLSAGPASAAPQKSLEPLNQYLVKGDVEQLSRLGYDLTEGGSKAGQGIVATPAQAEDLRAKGFTVTAPYGEAKTAKAAPPDPFATNPTYGWDVYRRGICSRPRAPGPAQAPSTARASRSTCRPGTRTSGRRTRTSSRRSSTASRAGGRTWSPTRSPSTRTRRPTGPSPSSGTSRPNTRVSGSRPRPSGACSATCWPTATTARPTSPDCCATRRCGSCR